MDWKKIELTDMELFLKAFDNIKSQASEMNFTNMFMWRKNYNTTFTVINNMLCMISRSRKYVPFAFCPLPLGKYNPEEFRKTVFELKEYFDSRGWKLFFGRVEERMLEWFKNDLGVKIEVRNIEGNADYIYSTESLITLSGKKLSAKRNHINKFMREYGSFEYFEISPETVSECKRIFDEWCMKSNECDCEIPEECEKWACFQLLDNWNRIGSLKGALIRVNGKFEAFTIGEMLNDDTAVIHIEKGNTDIHGIYALINREFVARAFPHSKYVNREEDMGKEGLRKAKQSYHPVYMINKYNIIPEIR